MSDFDPKLHLCIHDVDFGPDGVILTVRWSKVIQFRERILKIPLPKINNSTFCPSTALLGVVTSIGPVSGPMPLFVFASPLGIRPLSQLLFVQKLHLCLSLLGIPPREYSGHRFRRGGAMFALQCGLRTDLIKLQGDWNSNAYERYLHPSLSLRTQVAKTMGHMTASHFPISS